MPTPSAAMPAGSPHLYRIIGVSIGRAIGHFAHGESV
jgi:hypothetical protein